MSLRTIHHAIDEILLSAGSLLGAGMGWLVIVNQYLQAIAFIVSIIAGLLAIRAHFKKQVKSDSDNKGH